MPGKRTYDEWAACVGGGWRDIVVQLIENIDTLFGVFMKQHSVKLMEGCAHPWAIHQVKEKFGGLRFYWGMCIDLDGQPESVQKEAGDLFDAVEKMVDKSEEESFRTCEICGRPGKPRGGGWIKTLCDDHASQEKGESS